VCLIYGRNDFPSVASEVRFTREAYSRSICIHGTRYRHNEQQRITDINNSSDQCRLNVKRAVSLDCLR